MNTMGIWLTLGWHTSTEMTDKHSSSILNGGQYDERLISSGNTARGSQEVANYIPCVTKPQDHMCKGLY